VELTVPDLVQTVIVTRVGGRTPMPPREQLADLASHQATMAFFLSVTLMSKLTSELMEGGYPPETPAAVVHKATWPDQKIVRGTLGTIAEQVKEAGIRTQSMVLVGAALDPDLRAGGHRSRLYDAEFTHSFRRGSGWRPSVPGAAYAVIPSESEESQATVPPSEIPRMRSE
jgi:precorrin-4/cobalt-precorrin-4 C11-methyltransferase